MKSWWEKKRIKNFLKLIFFSYIIFLLFLAFYPLKQKTIPTSDKIQHFGAFFIFTGLHQLAFPSRLWVVLCSSLSLGGFIEIVQSFLSYRNAEWGDLGADLLGSLIGIIFFLLLDFYLKSRLNQN